MKKKKLLFLLLALTMGSGLALWDHGIRLWERTAPEGAMVRTLEIPAGTSIRGVGSLLMEGGWARSAFEWRLFCLVKGCEGIKAGLYQFPDREGLQKVVEVLIQGREATRRITIPEGRASWEIFSILKKEYHYLDSLQWEKSVHDPLLAQELGIKGGSLEGYLFPDTFLMPWEANEVELLRILVSSFQKVWNGLDTADSPTLKSHGKAGVVTLASIVEKESATPSEKGRIAGVFWNRLQQGISLGADPTVRFIFRSLEGPIYKSQLNSESPYNTRKFRGLPPGPIANPGRDALQATLHPAPTKDLYFVGKDDGSREHFFSRSLVEHNRYKEIAAQNRNKRSASRKR